MACPSRHVLTTALLPARGRLYHLITKNENQELQTVLDEDNSRAALRAADGRGPLFWAHEANNDEAIEMLKKAGASEDWQDADGKTCTNFEHGQMTEYMVRVLRRARMCTRRARALGPASACLSDVCLVSFAAQEICRY
jgi:ankyrin repeat protein